MTLNVQFSWMDYATDGVQTVFAYPFFLKAKEDLSVYWEGDPLASGFYTLTGIGNPAGGNLITTTPLTHGRLVLRRGTPQNQLTDYIEGDAFPAESHEDALDRLTVLVQDIQETLSRASLLDVTIGTPWRNLVLPFPVPNTVLGWDAAGAQWTLYPSGVTSIPVDPVSGIGWGKNTVAVRPGPGTGRATALLFPAGVRAIAVTAIVTELIGPTQGIQAALVGTETLLDAYGRLSALTVGGATNAGTIASPLSLSHTQSGEVQLSAVGGLFDGTGCVMVTGHFMTFQPSQTPGYSFNPGSADDSTPIEFQYATETTPGLIELATTAEATAGTDDLRAVTPLKLAGRLDAKLPAGTPLSVPRYATSGTALETTALRLDANTNLVLGAAVPASGATRALVLSSGVTPAAGSPDAVQITVADVDGIAGQAGVHWRFENNVLVRLSGQGLFSRVQLSTPAPTIAAPYLVSVDESGRYFVPVPGAGIMAQFTLPPAAAGLIYTCIVHQSGGIRLRVQGDDQIRLGGTLGSVAGAIECTTIGSVMALVAVNTVLWQTMHPTTGWTAIA